VADIGPILAALAAGAASAYSPYAARGIGTAANVLGAFDENRYRKIQAQRVQEGLAKEAEERRRKAEIESRAINFFTKNTEYGEPGQPFRPPAAGVGRGIPEQQAEALKLITLSRGAAPALESASDLLSQRAQPTMAEILARPRPPAGVRQSFKAREGEVQVSGPEKAEKRNLRFDVFDDPRGNRVQVVTDENTAEEVKRNVLGRVRVPSDVSVRSFTDDAGNFQVVGVGQGGGTVFQKSFGRTKGETKFNFGEYRKNLALRSRGQAVKDPEVQGMAPELAGQVMRDLKGSDFLEMLFGGAQANETGQKKRPMTPQEEADQYLQKR